ncbi:MAG TPA: Hsp20/alpha crystallin family protein [Candidatus Altiarchaeales archaeon]|nr:Hsp20/alpha crystallin family protein [Candidatus Altiarchaeales archaeon]
MFPWKRKGDWTFDDFFREFEREFREMEKDIIRIMEEERSSAMNSSDIARYRIYGFSITIGHDGEPRIERFGNISESSAFTDKIDERDLLVDMIEGDDEITVVAELPGVDKKDINLDVGEDFIEIKVDNWDRKYHKKLDLPCKVNPDKSKASYKNGVLEIRIKRIDRDSRTFNLKISD